MYIYINTPDSAQCISEKSTRLCGKGTVPGSDNTALICAIDSNKTTVLKHTTFSAPHKLKIGYRFKSN